MTTKAHTATWTTDPVAVFLDGLEASRDGRGFNAEHDRARQLLEAAPDLLAALELIVTEWNVSKAQPGFGNSFNAHEKARAALAKARGLD